MTFAIHAADSSVPRPELYDWRNFDAWGVYVAGSAVHIWTRAEVAELHTHGIEGAVPIVVPPQSWPWIMPEESVITDLVREAEAWGVPKGAPLVLDVEEWQAERMGSQLPSVLGLWRGIAEAAGYLPGAYGSYRTLASRPAGGPLLGFLAEWPAGEGKLPSLIHDIPPGYFAWQYAGGVEEGRLDLDLIALPATLMATDFTVRDGLVYFPAGSAGPTVPEAPVPLPADHLSTAQSADPGVDTGVAEELHPAAEADPTAAEVVAAERVGAELGDPLETEVPESAEPVSPSDNTATHEPVAVVPSGDVVAIAANPAVPTGYYVLTATGRVESVRCPHYGDVGGRVLDAVALAVTSTGAGYWIACKSGAVYPYGDAGHAATA